MVDSKVSVAESFKASLEDVRAIIERLEAACESIEELKASVDLALENEHHLKLMMAYFSQKPKAK